MEEFVNKFVKMQIRDSLSKMFKEKLCLTKLNFFALQTRHYNVFSRAA